MERITQIAKDFKTLLNDMRLIYVLIVLSILFSIFNPSIFLFLTGVLLFLFAFKLKEAFDKEKEFLEELDLECDENLDKEGKLIKYKTELKKINDDIKETESEVIPEECLNYKELIKEESDVTSLSEEKKLDKENNKDKLKKESKKSKIVTNKEKPKEDVSKYIRKLPKGRKASERAKQLALSYGYELKEGETFVVPKKKA